MSLKLTGSSAGSVSVDAPASTTGSADFTLTLPVAVGTAGQFLKNSSTPGTLEFGETPGSQACFGANMTVAQTINDNTLTKIICNNVQMNVGSGYDGTTGIFTVPAGMGGRYLFGYNARVYDIDTDDTADARLYLNGAHANRFWRYRNKMSSFSSNQYASLNNTQIVEVDAGDTVSFYIIAITGSTSDIGTYYTNFYGYKTSD